MIDVAILTDINASASPTSSATSLSKGTLTIFRSSMASIDLAQATFRRTAMNGRPIASLPGFSCRRRRCARLSGGNVIGS